MGGIRSEVTWFAEEMEKKLRENDHKGGWEDCDILWLYGRLLEEVDELAAAEGDDIVREAADVANFAMMIAHLSRKRTAVTA
ncbi:hypothetical protein ACQKK5_07950 [Brevibacillus panacihumi]|uniref:hypothetical protein n=1 Tax=Brevibacillus panacihumi TaxID=497735 RepID=UPI003CFE35A6